MENMKLLLIPALIAVHAQALAQQARLSRVNSRRECLTPWGRAAEALFSKSCHLSTLLQMALLKGAAIYKHLVADGAFKRSCHL
jgi:hypothetical protein